MPGLSPRLAEQDQLCTLTHRCHSQMLPNHETELKKNHDVTNRRKTNLHLFSLFLGPLGSGSDSQVFLQIFFILKLHLTSSPDSNTYGFKEKNPVL